ncbi:ABC transporter permease [Streptomyces sp. NPDC058735]|uniref:ABC transporter permease n=1 Tax=Streptomyces sp. NPDC058735 TaxID=3346616 RepID=UPI0036B0822A
MSAGQWTRDLAMGVRFAFAGGREGWVRALLTAVGVGLGVALLLLTTAVPNAIAERDRREDARSDHTISQPDTPKADDTLIVLNADTTFRDRDVRGRLLEAEGPKAPLPPGVAAFPAAGEMVVSPALRELLASDEGALLRERLDYRVAGTIGEEGLVGSRELAYFAGGEDLAQRLGHSTGARIDHFGDDDLAPSAPWGPVLLLLILVVFVVLLMPVAVFIAAAVRFGGERRDQRLAALRLVGSDSRATRRIAAGEALAGSVLGLVLGTGFFLLGRQLAASVEVFNVSVFPSYLNPSPLLAALVALAVPTAAVLVTILALRGVVIEPLGVVRTARPVRRRLWWRLLLPLGGLAMLLPMTGQGDDGGNFNQFLVVGGVVCLLVGVTALLPWVVETAVARLGAGGVAWQLAVRRLQLSSGAAARQVNGIAVAVAGAIALQMLFAGVGDTYVQASRYDVSRAQMSVDLPEGAAAAPAIGKYRETEGVRKVTALSSVYLGDRHGDKSSYLEVTVADCASLREAATLPSCRDGDVFAVEGAEHDDGGDHLAEPGTTLWTDPGDTARSGDRPVSWTVPQGIRQAQPREDPAGYARGGILLTPGALPGKLGTVLSVQLFVSLDPSVPDAYDHVRNTAARLDPTARPTTLRGSETNERFDTIRTGLSVGAVCVLALIGASLLVSQLEQLRERRRLLSALVALGTRRRTLSLSVLWQTAVPIGLGLLLAATVGMGLGAVLLRMADNPVRVDWRSVLSMTGAGAGVVVVVTLLSLPPLLRLMRPEGLRTE